MNRNQLKKKIFTAIKSLRVLYTGPHGLVLSLIIRSGAVEYIINKGVDILFKDKRHDMDELTRDIIVDNMKRVKK